MFIAPGARRWFRFRSSADDLGTSGERRERKGRRMKEMEGKPVSRVVSRFAIPSMEDGDFSALGSVEKAKLVFFPCGVASVSL